MLLTREMFSVLDDAGFTRYGVNRGYQDADAVQECIDYYLQEVRMKVRMLGIQNHLVDPIMKMIASAVKTGDDSAEDLLKILNLEDVHEYALTKDRKNMLDMIEKNYEYTYEPDYDYC